MPIWSLPQSTEMTLLLGVRMMMYDHENDSEDDYCDCNYDGDVYDDEDDNDKDRSNIKKYYPTEFDDQMTKMTTLRLNLCISSIISSTYNFVVGFHILHESVVS